MTDGIHPRSIDNRVVVRLHKAIIPPRLADVAAPSLECTTTDFVSGGPYGVQSVPTTHRFYKCDDEGFLMTAAGLIPRVVSVCEQRGIAVPIIDRSRWPILRQAAANLPDDPSESDGELLQAIVSSPRGRIVTQARDHLRLVSLICRVFATARVLIVTANREHRDRLFAKLKSRLRRPVSTHGDIAWGASNRVTVITSHFFAGVGRVNNDFDVILFLSPDAVTANQAFETAAELNHELIYCLAPPSHCPDELTQLRLEAICGAVIHNATASLPVVQVAMVEALPTRVPTKLTALERKRLAIWHNDQRNDFIAKIASAVASQDVSTFSHRSGFLNEHVDLLTTVSDPGVAVLVETAAHGRELQRRLPGWSLHTAIPGRDGVLKGGTCHRSISRAKRAIRSLASTASGSSTLIATTRRSDSRTARNTRPKAPRPISSNNR